MKNISTVDLVKKYIPIAIGVIIVLVIVLLSIFPPNGRLVCEAKSAPGDMSASYTYIADYSMWRVQKLVVTENVHSNNENDLIIYRQSLEENLERFKDLKYYDSQLTMTQDNLTNVVTIDFKNIDRKKLQELESGFSNRLTSIRQLKKLYIKNGATCRNE